MHNALVIMREGIFMIIKNGIWCVDEEEEVTAVRRTPEQVDPGGCELSKNSAETFRSATIAELNKNCGQLQNRKSSVAIQYPPFQIL